jgi:Cytochrome c7 and related cytochrome c
MVRTRGQTRALLAAFAIAASVGAAGIGWSMAASPYAPEQPIDFHHRDHLYTDRLDCELCHSAVRRSAFAGMPPVERCIGCHRFVVPEHPEVVKLRRYYDAGKTIPWIKVYSLPRFVRFNHEAHTLANVACGTCHGNVAEMDRVARVTPLTMRWCVRCHRESHAPDDCLTCHY